MIEFILFFIYSLLCFIVVFCCLLIIGLSHPGYLKTYSPKIKRTNEVIGDIERVK